MVRAVYIPVSDKIWVEFYNEQAKQTGHGLVGYQGIPFQHGNGLGSILGRLFRAILPVAKHAGKTALKTVGREALHMGSNVIGDLSQGRSLKQSLKQHGLKAGQNLIDKAESRIQSGQGLGKRKVVSTVSAVKTKRPRCTRKKTKQKQSDIFTNYHG